MGRPSKLTTKVQDKIVVAIRSGSSPEGAAQYAGIDRSTFYRWLDQGRRARSGSYRRFREAIEKAKADLETMVAAKVIKGINEGKLELAIQFLERRYPELWGRREALKGDAPDGKKDPAGGPVRIFLPPLRKSDPSRKPPRDDRDDPPRDGADPEPEPVT